jgi:EAL domain-containing protein (putative c-di-GMP-specific phosphodiesterase class I)/CheY-like chemotaxis protein
MKVDLKNVTVLYCEDEQQLREVTRKFLSKVLKKVYVAKDGQEGLELFRDHQQEIDMVISDIAMPRMDGLEMAKEIKKIIPIIPVIIITAYSCSSYLRGALDLHVDKYILKPLNLKDLIMVMEQSLSYHELRELYRDPLTGLQTGNALNNDLAVRPRESDFALVKIDDFEKLVDLYGETMTHKIIVEVSKVLHGAFEKDFDCYRTGTNIFALLAKENSGSSSTFVERIKEISNRLRHDGIEIDGTVVRIDTVVAVTKTISSRAFEFGLSALKNAFKTHCDLCLFEGDHLDKSLDHTENIRWVQRLDHALKRDRFKPYFQPIVETESKKVQKYEALLRFLERDDDGVVAPDTFLEIAQKSNIYPMITRTMLREVIDIIREKGIRIAVNISYIDFINNETIEFIHQQLKEHSREAKRLEFEILESEKIDNYDIAKEFIEMVRFYGCKIGIDDFGRGYSNFSMLEALHVDYVKIDGSLVREIDRSQRQEIVVEGIHAFCKKLGIYTIAEMVSCESEYRAIREIGIDYAQGWYFSKAIPAEEL